MWLNVQGGAGVRQLCQNADGVLGIKSRGKADLESHMLLSKRTSLYRKVQWQ